MMKTFGRIALVVAVTSAGGAALADNHGANPAVKARQSLMNLYAHYVGTLGAMAKGEVEYDAEKASGAANSLNLLTSELDQSSMWPPNSSNAELGDETRALPVIWSTYPAISEKAKAMNEATAAMVQAAAVDLASLQGAMKALGGSCGGCHKEYRQSKD